MAAELLNQTVERMLANQLLTPVLDSFARAFREGEWLGIVRPDPLP
jgi:hypothetical protein